MHDELWAGIELKLDHAQFHLEQMTQSLQGPERTGITAAMEASGAIVGLGFQRAFYAHLDAFLSATRSVAEIVKCCFGADTFRALRPWFDALPQDEQNRRHAFQAQYQSQYDNFKGLPLSLARHASEHRTGYPDVEVKISGLFGITYVGSPVKGVPISETPAAGNSLPFQSGHVPIRPRPNDFTIDGTDLFKACQNYLSEATNLVGQARGICTAVHGTASLTPPPL